MPADPIVIEPYVAQLVSDIFARVVTARTQPIPLWAKPRPGKVGCFRRSRSRPQAPADLGRYTAAAVRERPSAAPPPPAPEPPTLVTELNDDCWAVVAQHVDDDDLLALALTCTAGAKGMRASGRKCVTSYCAVTASPARIMWARTSLGLPWDERIAEAIAYYGKLDTLRCAREQIRPPCPWNTGTGVLRRAASKGHIAILKYARESGCKWDSSVSAAAGGAGELEALRWLRSMCCPWSDLTTSWAFVNGHSQVVDWALENGCEWNEQLVFRLRLTKAMSMKGMASSNSSSIA